MQANRPIVLIIAIILLTTLFVGLVSVSVIGQTNTTPLNASSKVNEVQASQNKHIIFRDDDIAPFADLDTLKAVNQAHIDKNVPVTLAIIPHPDPSMNGNELLMDTSLLDYLRSIASNPIFELAQHGYNHKVNGVGSSLVGGTFPPRASVGAGEPSVYWRPEADRLVGAQLVGDSEFQGRPYADQYNAIKQGWDDINEALGVTPTTFIPPWNVGDANTLKAAHAVGHTLYSTGEGDLSGVSVSGITVQSAALAFPVDFPDNNNDWNTGIPSLISYTDDVIDAASGGANIVIFYHFWAFQSSDGSLDPARVVLFEQYFDHLKNRGDVDFTTLDNQKGAILEAQTHVTLTASTTTPAVNQQVTFTATISSGGSPLNGKPIQIWHTRGGVRYDDATTNTDANGHITYTTSEGEAAQRFYYATFAGDSSYIQSLSDPVTVNVVAKPLLPTTATLTASNTNPAVNEQVTFTATLRNGTTSLSPPLTGKSVTIYHYLNNVRYDDVTANTDANGQVTVTTTWESAATRPYYAAFAGDSSYQTSTSDVVNVNVVTKPLLPTNATLTASNTNPAVNEQVTFTATLRNGTTSLSPPLTGKSVTIYHYLNNVRYDDVTANTDANGQVTVTTTWESAATRPYYAAFAGDSSYQTSTSDVVNVNVVAKPLLPTTATLTASNTNPAVNEQVTFTATLRNGTTSLSPPLTGKSVTIYHYTNGVRYNDLTANTNANGQITVTTTWDYAATRTYYAVFAGDSSYATSTSDVVTITVH